MNYSLPTSANIGGVDYEVRSDYRAVLDICTALSDTELTDEERAYTALKIFYPAFDDMPQEDYQEAAEECVKFINGGNTDEDERRPRLMDWEHDFQYIVAPINRVAGVEIRSIPYLHWWTFLSYYLEIGDCVFAQIVRIRDKLSKHKTLDKSEREWYRQNKKLVELPQRRTTEEDDFLKQFIHKG